MQSHKLSRRRFLQPDGGVLCGVAAGHSYLFCFPELLHPGDRHDWGEGVKGRGEGQGVRQGERQGVRQGEWETSFTSSRLSQFMETFRCARRTFFLS